MDVLFIGDIHGRDDWKDIAYEALPKFYKIVFLGDYVDSFDISGVEILHNLKEIIEFKKKYSDKVTLLYGNHDFAYINNYSNISGYKINMYQEYKKIFRDNHDLFKIAWGYTNPYSKKYTLATHAGLTRTYYNNYILTKLKDPESKLYKLIDGNIEGFELHDFLNFLKDNEILWKIGSVRGGVGTPGPLWADHRELLHDPYPYINQVFGHTASGTVCVTQLGDYFVAKVDGYPRGEKTANIIISL